MPSSSLFKRSPFRFYPHHVEEKIIVRGAASGRDLKTYLQQMSHYHRQHSSAHSFNEGNISEDLTTMRIGKDVLLKIPISFVAVSEIILIIAVIISFMKGYAPHFLIFEIVILAFSSLYIWLYIVHGNGNAKSIEPMTRSCTTITQRQLKLLDISFFLAILINMVSLIQSQDTYIRPYLFFISIIACYILIVYKIVTEVGQTLMIFAQIFITSFIICMSQYFEFQSSLLGLDPWGYERLSEKTIEIGFLQAGDAYSTMPIFRILSSITSMVPQIDYKMAVMISVSIVLLVLLLIVTYRIVNLLSNNRQISLMAMTISPMGSYLVAATYGPIPNLLGLTIALAIVLILVEGRIVKSISGKIVLILLAVTLVMTHSIVTIYISLSLLVAYFITPFVFARYENGQCRKGTNSISFSFVVLLFVFTLLWWSYACGYLGELGKILAFGFTDPSFYEHYLASRATIVGTIPILENITSILQAAILFGLGLFGTYSILNSRRMKQFSLLAVMFVVPLPIIATSTFLSTTTDLFSDRWFLCCECLTGILVGAVLLRIRVTLGRKLANGVYISIVFVLLILLLTTYHANIDQAVLTPDMVVRYANTDSELKSANFVSSMDATNVTSDWYFTITGLSDRGIKAYSFDENYLNGSLEEVNSTTFVFREYILENPIMFFGKPIRLDIQTYECFYMENYRIYSRESVSIIYKNWDV